MTTVDRYLKYANTKEKALTELVQKDAGMFRRVKLKGKKKKRLYFKPNSKQVYIVIYWITQQAFSPTKFCCFPEILSCTHCNHTYLQHRLPNYANHRTTALHWLQQPPLHYS